MTKLQEFYNRHSPSLRYIFFGGKGGVGKTVIAGACALWLAEQQNRRTLLASTNPVHSLSTLWDTTLEGGRPKEVINNLFVLEIDTSEAIKRFKQELAEKIRWFLRYADIPVKPDEFIATATLNPAFEESAMFENMIEIILDGNYDFYVFDTAPAANARRLLGMSKVYTLWLNKMLASRKEASALRRALSFSHRKEKDPIMEYLLNFQSKIESAKELLTDASKTAFVFVTLPEALPIAVIRRFYNWFDSFGIPIAGVIINGIISVSNLREQLHSFIYNKIKLQEQYIQEIYSSFPVVLAEVPLLEQEVRGYELLRRIASALFYNER